MDTKEMWFEKIGFDENPFTIKPLERFELVGYDDIVERLITRIQSSTMTFLEGDYGTGKTTILKKIVKKIGGKGNILYLDCDKHKGSFALDQILTERTLLGRKSRKDVILLIDEVETLDKRTAKQIKHYFDEDIVKSVIFVGTNYEKVGFAEAIKERISTGIVKVPTLSDEQIIALVRGRIGDTDMIEDELILRMWKITKHNPRKLLIVLERMFIYAAENGKAHIKDAHFNEAFKD